MTEAEWLTSNDPKLLFKFLTWKRTSQRKLRLFIREAFLPHYAHLGFLPREAEALAGFSAELDSWAEEQPSQGAERARSAEFAQFIRVLIDRTRSKKRQIVPSLAGRWSWNSDWGFECERANGLAVRAHELEKPRRSRLIRDIFGNPFRPAAFSPQWRTDTALTLATQMYESRDFSAMPILADALQDAGCDNEDILSHCRGEGPHVRGCWVVDLVLSKS